MNGSPLFSSLPLDLIVIPDNYILTFHRKNLCDVIRITNVMLPVVVKKQGERYVLVDGYDRLRCAKELGWREVPAMVLEDERTDVLRLALNYVRGKVCGIDVLMYVWQLSQQYDVSILAKILGREYETVRKYRSAAEHLLAIGLSKQDFEELHQQCVPIRRLIRCTPEARDRDSLRACLAYKPSGKRITPETVRKAVQLEKNPELQEAVDLIELVGKDKVERLLQLWDLARKTLCTRLEDYRKKILPEDFSLLKELCQ